MREEQAVGRLVSPGRDGVFALAPSLSVPDSGVADSAQLRLVSVTLSVTAGPPH